jgi:molybdate-binding protein/DNA-binding XRE family transcriptional regulator
MATPRQLVNDLKDRRSLRGWSQDEMARRCGLSRAGISAIETDRLIPSAAAALALAEALECRVEDIFRLPRPQAGETQAAWAWPPPREPWRYWLAEVGGRPIYYPTEATPLGMTPHDGTSLGGSFQGQGASDPQRTLVIASCDPAAGLLAAELALAARVRLIVLPRSSRAALALLGKGLVHAAGIHLSGTDQPDGNAAVVRRELGPGYSLLRVARWEEGVVCSPGLGLRTVDEAVHSNRRWIGREPGSGARQCLDELLERRRVPRRLASDHRGVAEAVRNGWADLGVCLRLVSEEAGLSFLRVRDEAYDLCVPERWEQDHRIQALVQAVRSASYRKALGDLPGYDVHDSGEHQRIL